MFFPYYAQHRSVLGRSIKCGDVVRGFSPFPAMCSLRAHNYQSNTYTPTRRYVSCRRSLTLHSCTVPIRRRDRLCRYLVMQARRFHESQRHCIPTGGEEDPLSTPQAMATMPGTSVQQQKPHDYSKSEPFYLKRRPASDLEGPQRSGMRVPRQGKFAGVPLFQADLEEDEDAEVDGSSALTIATEQFRPPSVNVLQVRNVIGETMQLKRAHLVRDNDALAQEARRLIATISFSNFDAGKLTPKDIVQLLSNATYFGFQGDDAVVEACLRWLQSHATEIHLDMIAGVIFACAAVQTKVSRELVETLAKKVILTSRYMSPENITSVLSAFSKIHYSNERLFFALSRRVVTLCRIGDFTNENLIALLDSVARARLRSQVVTNALMKRVAYGKNSLVYNAEEFSLVMFSFARLRVKDEKFIKRLAGRCCDLAPHLNALQVTSMLNSFAILGYRFDHVINALTARCGELIADFNAHYVSVTLQSFRRLNCNAPELFDSLAERALALSHEHSARDIAAIVSSLEFFKLADEELFTRLADHAVHVVSDFSLRGMVEVLHAFARVQFQHVALLNLLWELCSRRISSLDASQVRRVLYSLTRFNAHVVHTTFTYQLIQRCMMLYTELFITMESIEEGETIFNVLGKDYCPDLYAFFLSRSAAIAANPPPVFKVRTPKGRGRGRGGRGRGGRGRGRGRR